MFPAYGCKHTYPTAQMSSADCRRRHPSSEGMSPQMKMEPSDSPFIYETWPHQYGYPAPAQCHSCCNHNPYPSYYPYRPPYPHFPSSPLHPQCYGSYPIYPEPYPFHYAPPPHYTTELPNYEYGKSMPGEFYCCGCSHHKPGMNRDKGVKIEEQESEAENKEDSLIPAGSNNLQRPIVWVPPDYIKNQERPSGIKPRQSSLQEPNVLNGGRTPLDYEIIKRILEGGDQGRTAADHREGPNVVMPQQDSRSVEPEPKFGSEWMPLDVNSLKKLLQNGNLRRDHDDQPRSQSQQPKSVGQEPNFGTGWMPLDIESLKKLLQNGNLKRDHTDQPKNQSQQRPFPIIRLPHNDEEKGQARNEREASGTTSESSRQQPCKSEQGDDHTRKSIPAVGAEKSDKLVRTIPVKQMAETDDTKTSDGLKAKDIEENKKSIENGTKSKRPSPTRASKLPPICLRVDPLPKKKNGQGKSRSPSPRAEKVQQVDAVKPSSLISENEAEQKRMEVPQRKTETNIVEVDKDVGEKQKSQEAQEEKKPEEALKPEKKILSGTEAATVIQSAYRGYEVRRWEPLKKMRQISDIHEEAAALKRRIESGASFMDLMQKTALGETIMNLLLKLDTVQGLHSSVRDMRKSVAKELVSLQEMLDTIVIKQPDHSPKHTGDESSQSPGMNEAEAKGGETKEQSTDESSQNSDLEETEDQHGVRTEENTKDQISSSKELPVKEPLPDEELVSLQETPIPDEPSQSPGMNKAEARAGESSLSSGLSKTEDQGAVEMEETGRDISEKVATGIGEEAESFLSDSHTEHNEFDVVEEAAVENVAEMPVARELAPEYEECSSVGKAVDITIDEASIKPVDQESIPVVAEGNVDSADQTDMNHDLLAELPVAELAQTVKEEPDEASKGEVLIERDAESVVPENVQAEVIMENPRGNEANDDSYDEKGYNYNTSGEGEEAEHVDDNPLVEQEVVRDSETRMKDENEKMRNLLEKLIESGKEQKQVICSLNEKLMELEGRLARQKKEMKKKVTRSRKARVLMPRSCRTSNGFSKEGTMALAS